jgi:hypothetical protein
LRCRDRDPAVANHWILAAASRRVGALRRPDLPNGRRSREPWIRCGTPAAVK